MTLALALFFSSPTLWLPDLALTPGAADVAVMQDTIWKTICKPGYTATVRHVTLAQKRAVAAKYREAHDVWPTRDVEYDHLVSLELGGSNDETNLWPQPYCPPEPARSPNSERACLGAREKDVVETDLHRRICLRWITLADAQRRIVTDWVAEYRAIKARAPGEAP